MKPHVLFVMRQRGFEKIEADRDQIRNLYIEAEKQINIGVVNLRGHNHVVAVFRYGDNGDLIEAHSILGSM